MLHMVVITNDILTDVRLASVFDWRFSDYVYVTMSMTMTMLLCTFGNFSHVFTEESVDYFTVTYTFL